MTEEWRPVKGYEGFYIVSNLGNVRSVDRDYGNYRFRGKWLRPFLIPDENGYRCVSLSAYGESRAYKVHRLVAEAFVPNPENKPQVNHLDEDKLNNRADNLEWVTQQENLAYSNKGPASKKGKAVGRLDENGFMVEEVYKSITIAAKENGTTPSAIFAVLKGRKKRVHGKSFCYLNQCFRYGNQYFRTENDEQIEELIEAFYQKQESGEK
ncbi:NUMOD4 motif-containing protein [Fusobacterium naviforme]|nr:endonuclease [Fusobacterium naviforme]PSL10156.1 NUMOD4 motif-containing protein [Fusobacterium naviforme]STO27566.1 NUMOD4 motif [Fusobacterium naviforme]